MTDTLPRMKDHALSYARHGWLVVPLFTVGGGVCACPLGPRCDSPGKHPRTAHGVKDATADQDQVAAWWDQWPMANLGLATGAGSGLVVLDIDPAHDGGESLRDLELRHGELPRTLTSLTGGGGAHLLFAHPGVPVANKVGLAPGLDIRGDGGYIVAPPSLHASGQRYGWDMDTPPRHTPPAPLPAWLLRLVARPEGRGFLRPIQGTGAPLGRITEGGRNQALTRVVGLLRRHIADEGTIRAMAAVWNERQCDPPLDDAEVGKVLQSICAHPPAESLVTLRRATSGAAVLDELDLG